MVARSQVGYVLVEAAVLLVALGLPSCTLPEVTVEMAPRTLAIVQGGRGTVTVVAFPSSCTPIEFDPEPLTCEDVTDQIFGYSVDGLPDGVRYEVDESLLSPATPGSARITFEVGSDVPPGEHTLAVRAVLAGSIAGASDLFLYVLPASGTTSSHDAVSVAVGAGFVLAALADGSVRGWGNNGFGALGVGDYEDRREPSVVPALDGIEAVAAGTGHGLAMTVAGRVWSWGENISGQLGVDDVGLVSRPTPMEVEGVHNIRAIAAGASHSLALKSDGTVWAWGDGTYGQLGDGGTTSRRLPTQVVGLPRAFAIAASAFHSMAVAVDGSVWMWGRASLGVPAENVPVPFQVPGLRNVRSLATDDDTAVAVDRDGVVWAWGDNDEGQVGDTTTTDRVMPVRVFGLPPVKGVAVGFRKTLALGSDGTLWDWGDDASSAPGRLRSPGAVSGVPAARAIATGAGPSLAMLACGQLWSTRFSRDWEPVEGIGDDSDCPRVALRVSLAGSPAFASGVLSTDVGRLEWTGADYLAVFDRGTTVRLSARPGFETEEGERFTFDGWAVDCAGAGPEVALTLDRSRHCAAQYRNTSPPLHLLSVVAGAGGSVASSDGGVYGPAAIDCGGTCQAIFRQGTAVELTATPSPGFVFREWSGDCAGTSPVTTVVMSRRTECLALFRTPQSGPFTLSVVVSAGTSVASVVGVQPAGNTINCRVTGGPACAQAFPADSVVVVRPSDSSLELGLFPAWTGCDAVGPQFTCNVNLTGDRTVTATFTP